MARNHKDLDVWNQAISLAADIYDLTSRLPPEEKFGIAVQMRRAAVSIGSNIAEGAARGSRREFIRYLNISAGSASELGTQLEILKKIGSIKEQELSPIQESLDHISRMIQGMLRSLRCS